MGTESYSLGMARLYWTTQTTVGTQVDGILGAIARAGASAGPATAPDYGAFDLGNVVAAEIAPDITYLDHFVSVAGDRRKDKTVAITKSINIPITFDEISATNVENFFYGTDISSSRIIVFDKDVTPPEGAAVLVFWTDVGRDLQYAIPKAALKTEGGNLSFNSEDWIGMPFTIEVLYHKSYNARNTSTPAPYGFLDYSATSNAAPGVG